MTTYIYDYNVSFQWFLCLYVYIMLYIIYIYVHDVCMMYNDLVWYRSSA